MMTEMWDKLFGRKPASGNQEKKTVAGSKFQVRPDDVFIVSYPKSGNTWARFLIGNYITDGAFTFINSNDLIPDMHALPEKCEALKGQRIIKSHYSFRAEFPKVIYIVRDPRDVAVSYYYYYLKYVYNKSEIKPTFQDFFSLFIRGEVEFGMWDEHVRSWSQAKTDNVLILRYEDFIQDTPGALKKMLLFIYGSFDEKKMLTAVEASAFDKMAEQEKQQRMKLPRNAASDSSIPFIRKGEPGNFKEYLSEENLHQLREKFRTVMDQFKY